MNFNLPTLPELVREVQSDLEAAMVLLSFLRGQVADQPVLLDLVDDISERVGADAYGNLLQISPPQ